MRPGRQRYRLQFFYVFRADLGPGELSDGYRISRLLNIVVSGFDDFAHRMG
jgi:hypothetical protein